MSPLKLFQTQQNKSFRNDINGLRAVAVLPVLLFHAKAEWIKGGYLGVDVFFVISGYLIAQQLFSGLQSNKFTFYNFYLRRAKRLMPAYLFMAALVTIFAVIFMLPYNLKNFGQSLVASSLAINNILLYVTSGYWSTSAEFKPLYHTWSLAIEEQFYLFIPLIFFILRDKSKIITFLSFSFLVSFYFFALEIDAELRFLSLHSRAWELLIGAILSFVLKTGSLKNNFLATFGLFLILACYVLPSYADLNLIYLNILVVIGALVVISFSDQEKTFVGKFLSNNFFSLIGLLSYGIYLWHQPLIAFLRLSSEIEPATESLILVSLASIPVAYFSWVYVEKPLKNSIKISNSIFLRYCFFTSMSLIAIGLLINQTYGFRKINPKFDYGVNPQDYVDAPKNFIKSAYDENNKRKMLVIGNSFARDYINILKETNQVSNFNILYKNIECNGFFDNELTKLIAESNIIVFSQDWASSKFDLDEFNMVKNCVNEAKKINGLAKIIVFGVKNFGWNNNFIAFRFMNNLAETKVSALESIIYFDKKAKTEIKEYFSILSFFEDGYLMPVFDDNGKFLTYDSNHLTPAGALYVGRRVIQGLTKTLNDEPFISSLAY